jgi:hypothetical protein
VLLKVNTVTTVEFEPPALTKTVAGWKESSRYPVGLGPPLNPPENRTVPLNLPRLVTLAVTFWFCPAGTVIRFGEIETLKSGGGGE